MQLQVEQMLLIPVDIQHRLPMTEVQAEYRQTIQAQVQVNYLRVMNRYNRLLLTASQSRHRLLKL